CALAAADGPKANKKPMYDAPTLVFFGDARPLLIRLEVQQGGQSLTAAWEGCVEKLFRHLDVNDDGVLSKDEASRLPPPDVLFGAGNNALLRRLGAAAPAQPAAGDLDANG